MKNWSLFPAYLPVQPLNKTRFYYYYYYEWKIHNLTHVILSNWQGREEGLSSVHISANSTESFG